MSSELQQHADPQPGLAAPPGFPPFGDLLRRFRRASGLTQEQLAERAGLSVAGISALERGAKASPQRETVRLLAEALALAPADSQRLIAAIAVRQAPNAGKATNAALPQWMPPPSMPLIGREPELVDLAALLIDPGCRLLSLVGPGGSGKTRLAMQVAADVRGYFSDGISFVELASVRSVDLIASAIADALALRLHGGQDPQAQLLAALRQREMLLTLDNCEHLLAGAALIGALLRHAPGVTILATSRERLSLRDEWVFAVGGLTLPADDTAAATEASGAVRLFVESARKVEAQFVLAAEDRPHVARICRLVDGMPLALELAAAWVPVLPCGEIAQEIATNLDFLAAGTRDAPERQRSMRAVFEHSWGMLAEEQRAAFRRASVCRGGFGRAAAAEVAGASLFTLATLVSKSFLRRSPGERYEIHELLRQYGEAQLDRDADEARRTREQHCAYYIEFLAGHEGRLKGHEQQCALREIDAELENVRAAWLWATDHAAAAMIARAAEGLWLYHTERGRAWEGEAAFAHAVAALERVSPGASDDATREMALGMALARQASYQFRLGAYARARTLLDRSVGLFRRLGVRRELGFALNFLAATAHLEGDLVVERRALEESIALLDAAGDRWCAAYSRNDLGLATLMLGDADKASRLLRESLTVFEECGDRRGIAFAINNLGELAAHRGDYAGAERLHRASLALRRAADDAWGVAYSLNQLGRVARLSGSHHAAEGHLLGALRAARESKAMPIMLDTLVEVAALHTEAGAGERAAHLLRLVLRHPARSWHTRNRGERFLAGLDAQTQPLAEVARLDTRLATVEEIVDTLLEHDAVTRLG